MIGVSFNSQSNNDFYDPGIFLFTASSNLPIKKGVFRFLDILLGNISADVLNEFSSPYGARPTIAHRAI
jgi:hypothetical protein